ncbi:AI-2E family transporter [Candidatus Gracilibacteria bacterium]|nr:AI-2E family transporter [Candidatus Gracilibacteria bacterium]
MTPLRSLYLFLFSAPFLKKFTAYGLLIMIGYALSDFLILFFMTFLFAYIFLETGTFLARKIHEWGIAGKPDRTHRIARKYATTNIVVTLLYILFVGIVIFIFVNILPQIGNELKWFLKDAPRIATQGQDFIKQIEESTSIDLGINEMIGQIMSSENLENIGQKAFGYIANAGIFFTKFLISLVLSYIFIIDRVRVGNFLSRIRNGNFRFLYDEWTIVAKKIGSGFGVIFKAQSLIACVNAILTTIGLIIISIMQGGHMFPFIFTLSLIVFICGFIPVFGTFLSGIPILIIGYGYGSGNGDGMSIVIACIIMITLVHIVEAYYLNPKIVSSYVHFPIFITFLILLIAEHLFGLIGLLIGVPLFSIFMSIIEDIDNAIDRSKKKKNTHLPDTST